MSDQDHSQYCDQLDGDDCYNGWVNRETWLAAMHLTNDETLYNICREITAHWLSGEPTRGDLRDLAQNIGVMYETIVSEARAGESVFFPPVSDAILMMGNEVGSSWRVDWEQIVEMFEEDFYPHKLMR